MSFQTDRFVAAYRAVQTCADGVPSLPTVTLHVYDALLSTNQTAWEWHEQGAKSGTAVLALRQTGGRGQRGRQWQSEPGGMYLSVILQPNCPVDQATQLTLCTVWGVASTLCQVPGQLQGVSDRIPVQIKWLNDLVLAGKKLGGILTETRVQGQYVRSAVVGVGINWMNPVPPTGIALAPYLAASSTRLIDSLELLAALAVYGILQGYTHWQQKGMAGMLTDYEALMTHRDRPLMLENQPAHILGITATGELRVQMAATPATEIWIKPGTINLGYTDL